MRKSKFSEQEIDSFLEKIARGNTMEEISKKAGVTIATVYNWKKKRNEHPLPTDSTNTSNNFKLLEEENLKLKQLIANLSLEKQDLLDLLKKKNIL